MLKKIVIAIFVLLFCIDATSAQQDQAESKDLNAKSNRRVVVVVVLAGGGAKGFAHLAVLQRIEQDHVPIKKIIGTSIGAVIGGLYARGLTVKEIIAVVKKVDPTTIAMDQVARENQENSLEGDLQRFA
jgi:NTE family protein